MSQTPNRLTLACAAMDLCWLAACSHYLMMATTPMAPPLMLWAAAYLSGFLISKGFAAVAHRLIQRLLCQALVWAALAAAVLFQLDLLEWPRGFKSWYWVTLVASITFVFWYRGISLSLYRPAYRSVCQRFDLGLAMFFLLYVVDMLLAVRADLEIPAPFSFAMLLGFFLAGPAAIFIAVHPDRSPHGLSLGLTGRGALMAGGILVVLVCLAAVFLFNPLLMSAAELGTDLVKNTAGPLAPYIVAVLRFFLAPRNTPCRNDTAVKDNDPATIDPTALPAEAGIWGTIAATALGMAILITVGFGLILMAAILIKRLMAKSGPKTGHPGMPFLKRLALVLDLILGAIIHRWRTLTLWWASHRHKDRAARKSFVFLMKWGMRSGLPKSPAETPAEFGRRLGAGFPRVRQEIDLITSAFQDQVFGRMPLPPDTDTSLTRARQAMASPSLWGLRLRTRLRRPDKN